MQPWVPICLDVESVSGKLTLLNSIVVLRIVASSWYHTAKCQPNSPRRNSKEKCSGSYTGCLSKICCNPPPHWCKIPSHSAPILSSKMAATLLHVGQLCVCKSTLTASWVASWALRFLINLEYWFFSLLPIHCSEWTIPVLVYHTDVFLITFIISVTCFLFHMTLHLSELFWCYN